VPRHDRRIQCIVVCVSTKPFTLVYRASLPRIVHTVMLVLMFPAALTAVSHGHAQSPAPITLHVAAAADLQPVMPAIAAAYEHATGIKVVASFGSSATLAQQLVNGDPQDIFLSADYVHPEDLIVHGLADEKVPVPYATGILVLWARKDSPAQPLSLDSLIKPGVTRIAVANDLHAPYGVAATAVIKRLGLTEKLAPKLVVAENIAQTAQFVDSGNAQIGFISLTIASSPHFTEMGTYLRLPLAYPKIQQCAVVLKSSKNLSVAHDFVHWLISKAVQENLHTFGLEPAS